MVHVDRAAPRGHSTPRRRPLCDRWRPRRRSHSIGDNNPPPCLPFFNIAACLLACLPCCPPPPAHPPTPSRLGLGSTAASSNMVCWRNVQRTDRKPTLAIPCVALPSSSRARSVLVAVCTIPHLGLDLDGTASQCLSQCSMRPRGCLCTCLHGGLQARRTHAYCSRLRGGRQYHARGATDRTNSVDPTSAPLDLDIGWLRLRLRLHNSSSCGSLLEPPPPVSAMRATWSKSDDGGARRGAVLVMSW